VIGLIAAWRLFAIVFIWTVYPDLFWATVLLAGLLMMESGPIGVRILAAAFSQKEWLAVSWVLPFFVLGTLTHSILHAGVPAGYPGYYRFSLGRTLLVILLIPLMALLSWCASFFTSGITVFR
jgi:hypothetical protein